MIHCKSKLLFSLLAIVSVSACSTTPVKIVTYPAGAKVSVGSKHCISPCELSISNTADYITATLHDGRTKTEKIEDHISQGDTVGNILHQTGEVMEFFGVALALIGLGSTALFVDEVDGEWQDSEKSSELFAISVAAWLGSYALMKAGNESKKLNKKKNRIDIDFANYKPKDNSNKNNKLR